MDTHKMAKRLYELSYKSKPKTDKFRTQKIHDIEEWLEDQNLEGTETPESLKSSWENNEYDIADYDSYFSAKQDEDYGSW